MSRKDVLLPLGLRKGRESMKKKLSLCVAAALGAAVLFGGNAEAAKVSYDKLTSKHPIDTGVFCAGENLVDGVNTPVDKDLSDVNAKSNFFTFPVVYGVWATDNAILSSDDENISVSASTEAEHFMTNAVAVGADIAQSGSDYTDGGTVILGKQGVTKDIYITATAAGQRSYAVGLEAIRNPDKEDSHNPAGPARIEVNGTNLVIRAEHTLNQGMTGAAGIWVQNNTGDADNRSEVKVNTENTYISAEAKGGSSSGLYVMSQGKIEINSNLEIHANDAIYTRGYAITNINTDGQHSTKLYGDINFGYNDETSKTTVNADVNVNLTGKDSLWLGNSKTSYDGSILPSDPDKMKVTGFELGIYDGAQWTTDGDSFVNNLKLNDGIINIVGDKEQAVTITKLEGSGTVNMKTEKAADGFSTGTLNVNSVADGETARLGVNFMGINADDIAKSEGSLEKLAGNLKFGTSGSGISGDDLTVTANVNEGLIKGAISANIITTGTESGEDGSVPGHIVLKDVQQNSSTTMENMKNIAAVSIAAWRQEDSTLSQRLGDLRETAGGQGIWARVSRGEFEYSGEFKNQYNYFQIGWDMAKDDWHYGAAVSYNDGETTYSDGNGENSSTSLSLYGTRLLNDGQYFDIVLKAGRLNNKYDNYAAAGHTHGDYDAWGTEISGEYGKKIDLANDWFVTPQAQLSLMRIGSEDYTTSNGIHVDQDTLYSAVGRIGAEAGKKTAWGSLYAKASVLHDFAGDADTYLTYQGLSNSYSQDIGDTWYEAGFGANWKMSDSSYLYVDVIRTFGGDIETPWQWNAGVRWGF